MIDMNKLNKTLEELTAQVEKTETVEGSAVALINGFAVAVSKAVTDALTADTAANQVSIDAAQAAIDAVKVRFTSSGDLLGAAVVANTPSEQPVV